MLDSYNDILFNNQFKQKNISYNLDNINATMNIGKLRQKQEDSLLIINHPLFDQIQLLCVADGMGGYINGCQSSNYALLQLSKWFISKEVFNNNLIEEIDQLLILVDEMIRRNFAPGGTTLSFVIILNDSTIFTNIGDSRIYLKDISNNLFQLSSDHSITWELYKKHIIKDKDAIRFHKKNNLIVSRLGCNSKRLIIDHYILSNEKINNIFLFTDGITDCLSDTKIYDIINSNLTEDLSKKIVESAINNNSNRFDLNENEYYNNIPGGKDNLAAIVYEKKRGKLI